MKTTNKNLTAMTGSFFMILILASVGCSMKDRTEVHSVNVQLPAAWANSSNMSILNHSGSNYYSTPTNLGSFQCYALNVTGPGIQSDPRMDCTDPNSQLGQIAGFVPVSQGSIEMNVLAGANRKIELVGIQSNIGCPILNELLAAGGSQALHAYGEPYVLGSTTTDIFDDTAVTIVASFNSSLPAFDGCGDHNGSGGNSNELRLQMVYNSPNIQSQNCSSLGIYATGSGPFPSVKPEIVAQPTGGTATLYSDATCTNAVSSYSSFSSGNFINYWVKTSSTATGGFSAHAVTTATGWTTPTNVYSIVSDRIVASTSGNPNVNTCAAVTVTNVVNVANSPGGTLGTVELEVHNNTTGANNTPAQMAVYSGSTQCIGNSPITGTTSGGSTYYSLGNITPNSTTFYVKSSVGEKVSIGIKNSVSEPVQVGFSFTPFVLSTVATASLKGPQSAFNFALPFSGGTENAVDEIKFGAYNCGVVSKVTGIASCLTPPMPLGNYPINIVSNGEMYFTGYYITIGNQPMINNMTIPFNNCAGAACTYVSSASYSLKQSSLQALTLNATGEMLDNCGISPSLPSGLSLGNDCTISGSATGTSTTTSYSIIGSVVGTHYNAVFFTVSFEVVP